jgi:hypothetical protein
MQCGYLPNRVGTSGPAITLTIASFILQPIASVFTRCVQQLTMKAMQNERVLQLLSASEHLELTSLQGHEASHLILLFLQPGCM